MQILSNISFFCPETRAEELLSIVKEHWVNAVESCPAASDVSLSRLLTETQPGAVTLCLQWKSPSMTDAVNVAESFALASLHESLRLAFGEEALTFTSHMEILR